MKLVVPVVNSLTFIFTQIVSMSLGEETGNLSAFNFWHSFLLRFNINIYYFFCQSGTYFGIGLVVLGVSICVSSDF